MAEPSRTCWRWKGWMSTPHACSPATASRPWKNWQQAVDELLEIEGIDEERASSSS